MGLDGVNFDAFSYLHNVKKLRKQQKAEYKQTNKELTRKALSYVESNQAKGISAEQIDKILGIRPQRTEEIGRASCRERE